MRSTRDRTAIAAAIASALVNGSCTPRRVAVMSCKFDRGGLLAVLNQMDAGAQDAPAAIRDAAATTQDVSASVQDAVASTPDASAAKQHAALSAADAQSDNDFLCPAGMVLLMAARAQSGGHKVIFCRDAKDEARDSWNPGLSISGDFSAADIDAITAAVRRVDTRRLLSIVERDDGVQVTTGTMCGDQCGSGSEFLLKKLQGTWTIVRRERWVS